MDRLEVHVNLSQEEFSLICRICLRKGELKPFGDELSSLYFALTDIQVRPDDNLPNNICLKCISKLQSIAEFIDLSKLNDAGLREIIKVEHQSFSDQCEESMDKDAFNESTEITVKEEDQSTDFKENKADSKSSGNCERKACFEKKVTDTKNKRTISDSNKFDCFHCDKTFSSKNKLKVHMVSHSDEQLFECKLCGKKFKFSHNLVRHTNSEHKNLKPFKCEICHKDVDTDEAEHMKIHFQQDQEDNGMDSHDRKSIDGLLEFVYEESDTYNQGNKEIHKVESEQIEMKYYCKECSRSFRCCFNYKIHMRKHSGEKIYNCNRCRRKYLTEKALKEHQSDHDAEEYTCEICGKSYKMKDGLTFHLKTHSANTPYECKECGKSFKLLVYYNNHMKNHKTIKDFLCSVCGKDFTTGVLLRTHMRIHNGEKPFCCKMCGKCFTQSSALNLHLRNHTGVRNFRCTICDRAFLQHHHLQDHVKLKHTKEKEYKCRYCDKEFGLKSSLNRHNLIHTGEMPHSCSACGAGFRETRQLRNHAKRCPKSSLD